MTSSRMAVFTVEPASKADEAYGSIQWRMTQALASFVSKPLITEITAPLNRFL